MGMSNSDNEEEIAREHYMIESYKKLCPWDVPPANASEMDIAMWEDRVKKLMRGENRKSFSGR